MLVDQIHHEGYAEPTSRGSVEGQDYSCYTIDSISGMEVRFSNPYLMVGGTLYVGPESVVMSQAGIVALVIGAEGPEYTCDFGVFADVEQLRNEQRDYSKYIIPLYQFDTEGGTAYLLCDFRNIPSAAMGEFSV